MTVLKDRRVLVVGAGSPAEAIAGELSGDVCHSAASASDIDDSYVDRLVAQGVLTAGGLDLVVHAAYPAESRRATPIEELSAAKWHSACDLAIEAGIRLTRSSFVHLQARRGTIVYCVPLVGSTGATGFCALAAVSEGLRVLARSLARGWGRSGVRAHALSLHPELFVDAEHLEAATEATAMHEASLGHTPSISEIAAVIDQLAGPDTTALTGTTVVMDGGHWMAG